MGTRKKVVTSPYTRGPTVNARLGVLKGRASSGVGGGLSPLLLLSGPAVVVLKGRAVADEAAARSSSSLSSSSSSCATEVIDEPWHEPSVYRLVAIDRSID